MTTLEQYERWLTGYRLKLATASASIAAYEDDFSKRQEELREWIEARDIVQLSAQKLQGQVHSQITAVVSRCLSAVFDDPHEFLVHFDRKRGKTEARFVFVVGGNEIDPVEEGALGMVDVACFGLRVACLMLHQPPLQKVLILDEPMKYLDQPSRPRMASLIKALADETGIQFIIVTHDEAFMVEKVIKL